MKNKHGLFYAAIVKKGTEETDVIIGDYPINFSIIQEEEILAAIQEETNKTFDTFLSFIAFDANTKQTAVSIDHIPRSEQAKKEIRKEHEGLVEAKICSFYESNITDFKHAYK